MSAIDLDRTKAFPKNIEFDVLLTFTGIPSGSLVRSVTPSPSNLTVNQHHSFVELPDDNFKMRKFDPRSGSNPFIVYDYSTPIDDKLEQRFIVRHRLNKKFPDKELSEPIEPIIYYIDNGTPEPVKSALIEGGNWWNKAFELDIRMHLGSKFCQKMPIQWMLDIILSNGFIDQLEGGVMVQVL
jgi:hypothetical protein